MALTLGRTLVVTTFVVVASFVGTLLFAWSRLDRIDVSAASIVDNAAPSVEELADARGELGRLVSLCYQFVDGQSHGEHAEEPIRHSQRRYYELIDNYRRLPRFYGEDELYASLQPVTRRVDDAVDDVIDEVAKPDGQKRARALLTGELLPAVRETDHALDKLFELNSTRAREAAAVMREARRSSARAGLALGFTSITLAIFATVLAFRTLRAQARLIEQNTRLLAERASELESFAGRVAHDLRGPLSAMALRVYAAQGRDELAPAEVRALLGRIDDRVRDMSTLVDGLLDFALAGARPRGSVEVKHVVERVVREVEPEAAAAGARLAVTCETAARVPGSAGALSSVLSNLLRNAAKYIVDSAVAERRIELRVTDDGRWLRFEIEDNGPGIPSELQTRVFEPFVRGDRGAGAGLGLATVRRLVTAHGGRVGVRSELGVGTCFWFELPRAEPLALADAAGARTERTAE